MLNNPIFALIYFLGAIYIFNLWLTDLRAAQKPKNAFPGATYVSKNFVILGVIGILSLLMLQTILEILLKIDSEQSTLSFLALFGMTAAAFVEELIFRGYIVLENKGKNLLILSILVFSLIFALAHPYLWDYSADLGLSFNFGLKGFFSTAFIFLNSLWFYALRFLPANKNRSLIPCFAAHLAYNWGVYVIKLLQGFA